MNNFLPVTYQEMVDRGWEQPDFVYVLGDAYIDHPSFGAAIITRTLESRGFKVCILSQPNWRNTDDFKRFGKPRLGFLISSGNIDSMVNHYTVAKKRRHKDLYTEGSEGFKRPDRAVIVYSQMARQAYPDANIIIGGIEVLNSLQKCLFCILKFFYMILSKNVFHFYSLVLKGVFLLLR